MVLVELDKIGFAYGKERVLQDFSLQIEAHSISCLLGSSGCGKTTILRLIAGLEVPRSGVLRIAGQEVSAKGKIVLPPNKRKIGFVFQDLALWPHFTVYKNVAFALEANKETNVAARVEELLSFFDLQSHKDKYPHQLSGGQQQLLAIARALAPQPAILLMDEPLANLDVKRKRHILDYIRQVHKTFGTAIIYVTHDHQEAFSLAGRIVVLNKGKIEAEGSVEEIKKSENEYVRYFLEY